MIPNDWARANKIIEAEIIFLPAEEGKRPGRYRNGFRPGFCYDGEWTDAGYVFSTGDWFGPGDRLRLGHQYLSDEAIDDALIEFAFREGETGVAHGPRENARVDRRGARTPGSRGRVNGAADK